QQAERKLVAILAADIADCSRLLAVDKEGTLTRVNLLRHDLIDPKIKEHHSRIVEEPAGDRIVVEFGVAEDAMRCAIDVQGRVSWPSDLAVNPNGRSGA